MYFKQIFECFEHAWEKNLTKKVSKLNFHETNLILLFQQQCCPPFFWRTRLQHFLEISENAKKLILLCNQWILWFERFYVKRYLPGLLVALWVIFCQISIFLMAMGLYCYNILVASNAFDLVIPRFVGCFWDQQHLKY